MCRSGFAQKARIYWPHMSSESYHEPVELLSEQTKNMHRALVSLREELEAVDWYQQRAEACSDEALKKVLLHNKNEEVEHAMMTLEWLRRNDPVFDEHIGTYIHAKGDITEVEHAKEHGGDEAKPEGKSDSKSADGSGVKGSLGIGSLRGVK